MAKITSPSMKQIVKQSRKKILTTISSSCLIICGVVPVAVIFYINPFLSNAEYNQHPQETTKYLLMTAVPACLFLYNFTAYFYYASYQEGKLNLQGGVISRKQAIIITLNCGYYHLNTFLSVIAYPLLLQLATFVMSWETFMFYNLHCVAATMNIFFVEWVSYYHGIKIFSTQTILRKAKILSPSKIQFKKNGVMKKVSSKRKRSKLRVIKLSFLLVLPFLLISIFLFFFTGVTRYILQQSQLVMSIYCSSILLLKVCIQANTRKVIVKLGASAPDSVIYISILSCTVLVDCPIRVIFSQIDSSVNFVLVTSALGVAEVCIRCASVCLAIRKTEQCNKVCRSSQAIDILVKRNRVKSLVALIMLEVDADMASEYVAIFSSLILNCLFGHYNGFLVGRKSTLDMHKQVLYFVVQCTVEILVDFISYVLESHHPVIREVLAESISPSPFAVITANLIVGIYCMLVLILIMIYY